MESTTFHGQRINTSLLTVVHVGLKELPAQLLTGSTSSGTGPGQTSPSLLRSSSTVRLEEVVMEETLLEFINMLKRMVFLNKTVKTILPRTQITSAALTFRNVPIVLLQRVKSQEIRENVGLSQPIQSGK